MDLYTRAVKLAEERTVRAACSRLIQEGYWEAAETLAEDLGTPRLLEAVRRLWGLHHGMAS